jgi:hypothetical protein
VSTEQDTRCKGKARHAQQTLPKECRHEAPAFSLHSFSTLRVCQGHTPSLHLDSSVGFAGVGGERPKSAPQNSRQTPNTTQNDLPLRGGRGRGGRLLRATPLPSGALLTPRGRGHQVPEVCRNPCPELGDYTSAFPVWSTTPLWGRRCVVGSRPREGLHSFGPKVGSTFRGHCPSTRCCSIFKSGLPGPSGGPGRCFIHTRTQHMEA